MSKYNLNNQELFFPEELHGDNRLDDTFNSIRGTKAATAFLDSKLTREVKKVFTSLLEGLRVTEPEFSSLEDLQEFALTQGYSVSVLPNGNLEISDSCESELSFNTERNSAFE